MSNNDIIYVDRIPEYDGTKRLLQASHYNIKNFEEIDDNDLYISIGKPPILHDERFTGDEIMTFYKDLPTIYVPSALKLFIDDTSNESIVDLLKKYKMIFTMDEHEDFYEKVIDGTKNKNFTDNDILKLYLNMKAEKNPFWKSDYYTDKQKYEFLKKIANSSEDFNIVEELKKHINNKDKFEQIKNTQQFTSIGGSNTVKHKYLKYKQKYLHLKQKIDLQ